MKKLIIIALLAYLGLGGINYLYIRSQIADVSAKKFNEFLDNVAEINPGVTCGEVKPFGSELSLEFFYSTEYVSTAFLLDPKGRPFKIAVHTTDTTLAILRPFGVSSRYIALKRKDLGDLLEQREFCERKG